MRNKWLLVLLFCLFFSIQTRGQDFYVNKYPAKDFAFIRIFKNAEKDVEWKKAKSISYRLMIFRKYALKHSVMSNPVSDRYMLTCYGGTIDLVHFLCLAAEVCSGKNLEKRLYQEWLSEGGIENLKGYNTKSPPEATPEDLPSNALGALFGQTIQASNEELDFNVLEAFLEFIDPLIPVSDKIRQKFSYSEAVLGLTDFQVRNKRLYQERHSWFSAEPIVHCKEINKLNGSPLCKPIKSGVQALNEAGLSLSSYKERKIVISFRE